MIPGRKRSDDFNGRQSRPYNVTDASERGKINVPRSPLRTEWGVVQSSREWGILPQSLTLSQMSIYL